MIFKQAGFTRVETYRYWHAPTRSLDFTGMCEDLTVILEFKRAKYAHWDYVVGATEMHCHSTRLRTQSNRMRSNARTMDDSI
jgi:aspartate/tyrosine/aromatic aminotransferase